MNPKNFSDPKAFSLNFDGLSNRLITDIGICEFFDPATVRGKVPQLHKTTALWDTGATNSIITKKTAEALNLTPIGRIMTNHGGGQSEHSTHLVNLMLPNQVGIVGVQVTEMEHIVDNFGVIVGMDVIIRGDLSITNHNGKTCFSFRIPSLHKVDYVDEWNRKFKNVRPNDFCPCQSGKKFKRCHGEPQPPPFTIPKI